MVHWLNFFRYTPTDFVPRIIFSMSCAPFSLLLSTSQGFFNAERSPNSLLPHVLEASCSAPSTTCSNLMSKLAETITSSSACKDDLAAGNSLANQALTGFKNYDIMRQAGCLKDNSTSQVKIPLTIFFNLRASSKTDKFSSHSIFFFFLLLFSFVLQKQVVNQIVLLFTFISYQLERLYQILLPFLAICVQKVFFKFIRELLFLLHSSIDC